jgi:predicted lipoprotein with Yx(FWY)xxD motif
MHTHDSGTTGRVRDRGVRLRRRRLWAAVPLALGTLALTAACGSDGGTSTAASSASATAPAATGAALAAASTGIGTILVDGTGLTVYDFANDTGSTSTCTGGCAQIWRPVVAPDPLPASLTGVPAELGTTARTDGTEQLTVGGHPVYTYQGDDAPGQTNGNGLTLNGGLWTAVSPDGTPLAAGSSTDSSAGSSAPSIGY